MSRPEQSWNKNGKQAAAVVGLIAFFGLSLWLGDDMWGLAEYWPGGAIGFGVTVGALVPITFTAAKRSFRRADSAGGEESPRRRAAGIAYATVAVVSGMAASRAIPARSSSRPCVSEWSPCWVNHLYPGAFFATLGSLLAAVAVMTWLPNWVSKLRVRAGVRARARSRG